MTENQRVWSKFEVKTKDGEVRCRIQEMPKHCLENVADLFNNYFAKEETMHKVAGIPNSEDALAECRGFVKEMLTDPSSSVVICCLDNSDDVDDIIGASMMVLCKKDEPEDEDDFTTKTEELGKMFEIMGKLFSQYDAMKELNLDIYYDDRGVVVHPKYRGLGIAQKLFNARRLICQDKGVSMTGAWVTSAGSQKAAERDGWETVFEVSYDDFGKEHKVVFKDVPQTCKFVVAKV